MSKQTSWPNRVNVGLTDADFNRLKEVRRLLGCNPERAGFVDRILFYYALRHADEAINEFFKDAGERMRRRRALDSFMADFEASRSAARSFIEAFEKP